jgi:signal transduction histidine kinase
VIADRQRLTQAMMQLAQNAVQHTSAGDEIEIGSRVLGVEVELWVRDTGEGISPDEVERIFDRFARGGRKRASDGAGLGLSIVRAIAEAHHGRVSVRSRPGEGSRFVIVVPVDQPLVAPEELA